MLNMTSPKNPKTMINGVDDDEQPKDKKARERERRRRRRSRKQKEKKMNTTMHQSITNPTLNKSINTNEEAFSMSEADEEDDADNPVPQEVLKPVHSLNTDPCGSCEKTQTQQLSCLLTISGTGTNTTAAPRAQIIDMGGGISLSGSKRKKGATPDNELKKAKVSFSTSSDGIGLEANVTPLQAPVWTPEFFIGGNPGNGPLRADHSSMTEEAAVGLIYGARLPTDIAYFAQCEDSWELYTHIARCLAGAIGGTTELHKRATILCPSTHETAKLRSFVSRLEEKLACKNFELVEASKRVKKQAEKIANQATSLESLIFNQGQMRRKLAEKNEQCKMIEQQFREECQKHKKLQNEYNQLKHEKKEQEDVHIEEVARLNEQYEKKVARQNDTEVVKATLEANQMWQSTCNSIETALGVDVRSSEAIDPTTTTYTMNQDENPALLIVNAAMGEVPSLMPTEFSSNDKISSLISILDLESESELDGGTCIGESMEEVEAEPGSGGEECVNELAPTTFAIKLQYDKEFQRHTTLQNEYNQLCEKEHVDAHSEDIHSLNEPYKKELVCQYDTAVVKATLETSQIWQSTCDTIETAPGVDVRSYSEAIDPTTTTCTMNRDENPALWTVTAEMGEVPPLMPPEFISNGEVLPLISLLDLESMSEVGGDTYMGESKEEVEAEPGSNCEGIDNELAPTELATKLHFVENEAAMVKGTPEASQSWQSTCDLNGTAAGVDVPCLEAFDPLTTAGTMTKNDVVTHLTVAAANGETLSLLQHEFNSNGKVSALVPFLDLEDSEGTDTYMGESKEGVKDDRGSSSKRVVNVMVPTQLAINLQLEQSGAQVVKKTPKAIQVWQSTCDPIETALGVKVPSSEAIDPLTASVPVITNEVKALVSVTAEIGVSPLLLPEFSLNGGVLSLMSFPYRNSESCDTYMGESKEEAESGSSRKAVEDDVAPTKLPITLQIGENEAGVFNETLEATQVQQSSCDPVLTTPGVELPPSDPANFIAPAGQEPLVHATTMTRPISRYGIILDHMARLLRQSPSKDNSDPVLDTINLLATAN